MSDIKKDIDYLDFMPSIYRGPEKGKATIFENLLKIFRTILTDADSVQIDINGGKTDIESISETIGKVPKLFHPSSSPKGFLDWLASWTGLVLKEDWSDSKKKEVVAKIIPIYRMRGTKTGLLEFLKIFVGDIIEIAEFMNGIKIGDPGSSKIGINTFVGGVLPYFFIVTIKFSKISEIKNLGFLQNVISASKAILDLEKPAHTYYAVRLYLPGITVGDKERSTVGSTVGEDTIIGKEYPFFI